MHILPYLCKSMQIILKPTHSWGQLFGTVIKGTPLIVHTHNSYVLENRNSNITIQLAYIIKAFQNPIWAEQARERLKQINLLTRAATI